MRRLGMIAALLALAACATALDDGKRWVRIDGAPAGAGQLDTDIAVCNGEMRKAEMAATRKLDVDPVGLGCMAQRGWRREPG